MLSQFNHQSISDTLNDSAFKMIYAIERGINNKLDDNPIACVKNGGEGLWICVKEPVDDFEKLIKIFPKACQEYGINKLENSEDFARKRVMAPDLIKYEFNISIEDFHKMMLAASDDYKGYRGGNSLLHLKNPTMNLVKEGTICVSPALELSNNQVMLRLAGCNTSEIISTQLALLIKQHLPEENGKVYGHHISPMLEKLGFCANTLFDALTSYLKIFTYNLKLKENVSKIEAETVYFEVKNNALHYIVKKYPYNHCKETIEGTIDASELPFTLEPLTQEKLEQFQEDLLIIISQKGHLSGGYNHINHQSEDGFRTVNLNDKTKETLIDMNPKAFEIYKALGPVEINELDNLKSIEIPILDFLNELIEGQKNTIEEIIKDGYYLSSIPKYRENIDFLERLITKVKEKQMDNDKTQHKIKI